MELSERSFGLLIAYLIPGWVVLLGVSLKSTVVAQWMAGSIAQTPSVAGFLFATLASIAIGVFVSTVRWLTVDRLIGLVGVKPTSMDFGELHQRHLALKLLIESHYRYYQFHSNLIVALPIACLMRWHEKGIQWAEIFLLLIVVAVLTAGAYDTLEKYFKRMREVLAT